MDAKTWFTSRTFHHSAFADLASLVEKKKQSGLSISVGIPTLNEENTIGHEVRVIREHLMEKVPLVDEVAVIDSGSNDRTREESVSAGAQFYAAADILPEQGHIRGKGENLWKSLWVLKGDIIVWLDADIKNISPKFVYGLVGPLLQDPAIGYVKAFYNRPLHLGNEFRSSGGGRVTEIVVRPLLSLYYPDLAFVMQPLSGEYAGRREILEQLPFSIGYGVETGHLLDLVHDFGLGVMGQVDMDVRIHRNRTIHDLGRMSFGILQTFFNRAKAHGKLVERTKNSIQLTQFLAQGEQYIPETTLYREIERPPICSLDQYRNRRARLAS